VSRVTVVGAGAIGGTIGGLLQRAGTPVDLIQRDGPVLRALREHGLRFEGPDGAFAVRFAAVRSPDDDPGVLDLVLVAVKGQATEWAARLVARHLAPDGVVVTLQNGLTYDAAAAVLGEERVLPAMVHLAAQRPAPGVVRYARGEMHVGEPDGNMSARLERVARCLRRALPVHVTDNIQGFQWGKLVYSAMQCAQALVDATTSEVMAQDWVRPICVAVESEVAAAARASGVRIESYDRVDVSVLPPRSAADLARALAMLPEGSDRQSSFGRDLSSGIPGEIDYVCGAAARIGRAHGLPMRLNGRITELIHEIEEGRRQRGWENLRELEPVARALLESAA